MTLRSKENYINAATIYAWDELTHASIGGEACLTTVFGNPAGIPDFHPRFHLNNNAGKLSRLMVATRKYKETYDIQASRRKAKLGLSRRSQWLTSTP
jgi:hypothetical protein